MQPSAYAVSSWKRHDVVTRPNLCPLPSAERDVERRLVKAAQLRDRAAFNTLVQTHRRLLQTFLIRRVGSDASEDILQETFLAAWQAIARIDLKVRFKTWLFRIAICKMMDHHRSNGKCQKRQVPLESEWLESEPDTSIDINITEQRETVRTLLARLTPDQRQLLEMYYFLDLTLPEIAERLNCNLNTLKYRFYRVHALAAQHRDLY